MSDQAATIGSALIGAVIGSVGVSVLNDWLARRTEKRRLYESTVKEYLLLLQDAVESLWHRLYNIEKMSGRTNMEDEYYETTTLYVLARVLALKHIIVFEGVYYNIERVTPSLGIFLRDKLEAIDRRLDNMNYEINTNTPFFRYDRQVLAESVMSGKGDRLKIGTLIRFKECYPKMASSLIPAKDFVMALDSTNVSTIRKLLSDIAFRLEKETGITTSVRSLSESAEQESVDRNDKNLSSTVHEVVGIYDSQLTRGHDLGSTVFWEKHLKPVLLTIQKNPDPNHPNDSDLVNELLETISVKLTKDPPSSYNDLAEIRNTYSGAINLLQKYLQ